MNRVQMRGLFWELVGHTSGYSRAPGSGSPAGPDLDSKIAQAITEMIRSARPVTCRKYGTIPLVSGTERYALPTDFLDWWDITDDITIGGQAIRQLPRGLVEQWRDAGETPVNADSLVWYEAGIEDDGDSSDFGKRMIGFYPVPSASATAKLHYLRAPLSLTAAGMTDSTEYPDIPSDYHEAAVYFAVWKFYQNRKERPPNVDISFLVDYYNAKLAELKRSTAEHLRPNFRPTTMHTMSGLIQAWDPID